VALVEALAIADYRSPRNAMPRHATRSRNGNRPCNESLQWGQVAGARAPSKWRTRLGQ